MNFWKDFGKGAIGALVVALQGYLAGANFTKLGLWATLAGFATALISKGLAKLREKLGV